MSSVFKCLVLDHDDTAVTSTAAIHYPAHLKGMEVLRPGIPAIDLEGWYLKNFHPGVMEYLVGELGLSEQELEVEYRIWREFNTGAVADFFPGFLDALKGFREQGGIVTVVSHSERDVILKAYKSAAGNGDFMPDLVFGWDPEQSRRKPSPWPVEEILRRFGLEKRQVLVLDDLKPGVLMSQAAGVAVAGAGWAHRIPQIQSYMRRHCLAYFETVAEFREFILG